MGNYNFSLEHFDLANTNDTILSDTLSDFEHPVIRREPSAHSVSDLVELFLEYRERKRSGKEERGR